jgi:hypothetical protein
VCTLEDYICQFMVYNKVLAFLRNAACGSTSIISYLMFIVKFKLKALLYLCYDDDSDSRSRSIFRCK